MPLAQNWVDRTMPINGTPGINASLVRIVGQGQGGVGTGAIWQGAVPLGFDRQSGTWTVKLEVSQVFHSFLTWKETHICLYSDSTASPACSNLSAIASDPAVNILIPAFSPGVFINTLQGMAGGSEDSHDTVVVTLVFVNSNANAKGLLIKSSQTVEGPWQAVVPSETPLRMLMGVGS